jgi:hypothetical protein
MEGATVEKAVRADFDQMRISIEEHLLESGAAGKTGITKNLEGVGEVD